MLKVAKPFWLEPDDDAFAVVSEKQIVGHRLCAIQSIERPDFIPIANRHDSPAYESTLQHHPFQIPYNRSNEEKVSNRIDDKSRRDGDQQIKYPSRGGALSREV